MQGEHRAPIRILVVEDEGITALDTCDRLRDLGYVVTASVFSGTDALCSVAAQPPDLVLMDIRLKGGMDGLAAAREIRARCDIPIIYATAYADDATVQRAKVTEPFGYILKPFDERELRTTIEVALYKHGVERQRADFLAMLSHDIRNPLGVILAYTEMLGEDLREGDRAAAEDLLERLTSTTRSLHSLVTNYLEASRIENGNVPLQRERVQLDEIVTRVCEQYEAEARRRHIRLGIAAADRLPPVDADSVACERILTNLVHNALKFTPADGRVTITSTAHAHAVSVAVADTGSGIPPASMARLFDRHHDAAAPERGGGTGLGLFIVRTLAEGLGGQVEVASTPGSGTCFTVSLPVAVGGDSTTR